jgi:hypothetical protein
MPYLLDEVIKSPVVNPVANEHAGALLYGASHNVPNFAEYKRKIAPEDLSIDDPNMYAKAAANTPWTEHTGIALNNLWTSAVGMGANYIATIPADVIGAVKGDTDTWASMLDTFGGLGSWSKNYMAENMKTDMEKEPGSFNPADPAWWANVIAPGVGSVLGMAVPSVIEAQLIAAGTAAVTGGVGGVAGEVVGVGNAVRKIGSALKLINSARGAKTAFSLSMAYSGSRNALMNAAQTYDDAYAKLKSQGINDVEANKYASTAATQVYRKEAITGAILGGIQGSMMMYSPLKGGLVESSWNPVTKVFNKIPNKGVRKVTEGLTNALIEGEEEGREQVDMWEGIHTAEVSAGLKNDTNLFTDRLPDYMQRAEIWNNVAGGFIGGAFMPGLGSVSKKVMDTYTGKSKYIALHHELMKDTNQAIGLDLTTKIGKALNEGKIDLASQYISALSEHKALNGLMVDKITGEEESAYEAHVNFLEKTLAGAKDDTEDHEMIRLTYPLLIAKAKRTSVIFNKEVENKTPFQVLVPLVVANLRREDIINSINENNKFITDSDDILKENKISELGSKIYETKSKLISINAAIESYTKVSNKNAQIDNLKSRKDIILKNLAALETSYETNTTPEQKAADLKADKVVGLQERINDRRVENYLLETEKDSIEDKIIEYRDPKKQVELKQKSVKNTIKSANTTDDVDAVVGTVKDDPEVNIKEVEKVAKKRKVTITSKTNRKISDLKKKTLKEFKKVEDQFTNELEQLRPKSTTDIETTPIIPEVVSIIEQSDIDESVPELTPKEEIRNEVLGEMLEIVDDFPNWDDEPESTNFPSVRLPSLSEEKTKERANETIALINDYVKGMDNKNPTFKEIIQDMIDFAKKKDKVNTIEKMYEYLKEGWKAKHSDLTEEEYNKIYSELFDQRETAIFALENKFNEKIAKEGILETQEKQLANANTPVFVQTESGIIQLQGTDISSFTGNAPLAISSGSRKEEVPNELTGGIDQKWVEGGTVDKEAVKFSNPDKFLVGDEMIAEVHPNFKNLKVKHLVWQSDNTNLPFYTNSEDLVGHGVKIISDIPTYGELLDGVTITFDIEDGEKTLNDIKLKIENEEDYWNTVPIVVYGKGKQLSEGSALLRDLNWFNPLTQVDPVKRKDSKLATSNLRNEVRKRGKIDLVITEKNTKNFSPNKTKEGTISLNDEKAKGTMFGIYQNREVKVYNPETGMLEELKGEPTDLKEIGKGQTVSIIKLEKNSEGIDVYLVSKSYPNTKPLSEEVITSIMKVVELFCSQGSDPKAKDLILKSGIPLNTPTELKNYVYSFVYSPEKIIFNGRDLIFDGYSVSNNSFALNEKGTSTFRYSLMGSKDKPGVLERILREEKGEDEWRRNVGLNALDFKLDRPIKLFNENGEIVPSNEFATYADYINDTLTTNVTTYNVNTEEEPVYSPCIQPFITVGIPKISSATKTVDITQGQQLTEVKSKELEKAVVKKLDVEPNIQTNIEVESLTEKENKELTSDQKTIAKAFNDINGLFSLDERISTSLKELFEPDTTLPSAILDIDAINRINAVIKSIDGISFYELNELATSFASIYSDVLKNTTGDLSNISEDIKKIVKDHISNVIINNDLEENISKLKKINETGKYANLHLLISDYDTLFDKIKQIQEDSNLNLLKNKILKQLATDKTIVENEDINDEGYSSYDKNAEERDFHDKAGVLVRKLLFNQPDLDTDGNQKTGFLGLPMFVAKDYAFDNTISVLADKGGNLREMVKELKENSNIHPWMWLEDKEDMSDEYKRKQANTLVGRLLANNEEDLEHPNSIQSNFSVVMNNYKFAAKFMYMIKNQEYDREGRFLGINYNLNVYDSGSSSIAQSHLDDWHDNIRRKLTVLDNTKESIFDKEKAKEALAVFDTLSNPDFKDNKSFNSIVDKADIIQYLNNDEEFTSSNQNLNNQFKNTNVAFYSNERGKDKGKYILEKTNDGFKFKKYQKFDTDNVEKYVTWLDSIGIRVSNKLIEKFMVGGYRDDAGKSIPFNDLFVDDKGIFGYMANKLRTIVSTESIIKLDSEGFKFNDTKIRKVAKAEARYTQARMVTSFRDSGKTFYGFVTGSLIHDRTNALKSSDYQERLLDNAYSQDSDLLKLIRESDEFRNVFSVFTIGNNAFKIKDKRVPEKNSITDLSDTDHEITKIGFLQNTSFGTLPTYSLTVGDNNFVRKIANMFGPTYSDKTSMKAFTTAILDFRTEHFNIEEDDVKIGDGIREHLYNQLVNPELKRIIEYHSDKKFKKLKYNGSIFYQIPELNNLEIEVKGNKVKLIDYLKEGNNIDGLEEQIKEKAGDILDNFVKQLVDEKIVSWTNNNIIKNKVGIFDKNYMKKWGSMEDKTILNKLVANDFVINYLLHNSEMSKLYYGDPAFYYKGASENFNKESNDPDYDLNADIKATYQNITKRLARIIAPGQQIANSKGDSYIQLLLDDHELKASSMTMLINALGEEAAIDYRNVNETDAQEYTTWQEHVDILHRLGKSPDSLIDFTNDDLREAKKLFSKNIKYKDFTDKEKELVKKVLQPIKPVYTGDEWDSNYGIMRPVYIKSSSFPLIPQLTEGLEIDKLRVLLENIQSKPDSTGKVRQVRASYQSANKVGSVKNPLKMFEKDTEGNSTGKLKYTNDKSNKELTDSSLLDTIIANHTVVLNRENFRIQQDIPYKSGIHDEDTIANGTQMNKLILANGVLSLNNFNYEGKLINGKEVYSNFNSLFEELLEHKKNVLLANTETREQLQQIINAEAEKNGIQDIAALQLDEKGNFKSPIWSSPNAYRYEALLQSIINKQIIKFKMPGYSYVAGSSAGFNYTDSWVDINQSNIVWTGKPINKLGHNDILVPSKFRIDGRLIDLLNDTNKDGSKKYVKLITDKKDEKGNSASYYQLDKEKIDDRLWKLICFRIPTSNHSSLSFDDIVGFLPAECGDLMLVADSKTMQKGLDFDADKENTYHFWTGENKDGKIVPLQDIYNLKSINEQLKSAKEENAINDLNIIKEKLLNNKMIELYQSVLSHDEVKKKTYQTLSISDAKRQAAIFDKVISKGNKNTLSFISDEYQKQTMITGTSGKNGTSVYSALTTFNGLLEQITINNPLDQLSLKEKYSAPGEKDRYMPFMIVIDGITFDGKLGNSKVNPQSRDTATVIGERQNIAVDNATAGVLGKININEFTFSVDTVLCLMGIDKGTGATLGGEQVDSLSFLFLNQPIIRDYVIEMGKLASNTINVTNEDEYVKGILINDSKYKTGDGLPSYEGEFTSIKFAEEITKMSTDPTGKTLDKQYQRQVLELFLELKEISKAIRSVQSISSLDSQGLGKSLFDSLALKEKEVKILGDNKGPFIVENRHKILADTLPAIYLKAGLDNSLDKWMKFFPYKSHPIVTVMEQSGMIRKNNPDLNVEQKQKTFSNIRRYFHSFRKLGIFDERTIEDQRKDLFIDNEAKKHISLASYLKDLWTSSTLEVIKKNPIFLNMSYDIKVNGEPSAIKYNNTQADALNEDVMQQAFISLLGRKTITDAKGNKTIIINPVKLPKFNGKEYDSHKLLNDLIKYAYLEGGIQEANQYVKYIPNIVLEELGFNKTMRQIHTNLINSKDEYSFDNNTFDLLGIRKEKFYGISRFNLQELQHNPQTLLRVKFEDLTKVSNYYFKLDDNDEETNPFNKILSLQMEEKWKKDNKSKDEEESLPMAFSVNYKGEYYIFLEKDGIYYRVPTLGHPNMSEYNMNDGGIVQSIIHTDTNDVDPIIEAYMTGEPIVKKSNELSIKERNREGAVNDEPIPFSIVEEKGSNINKHILLLEYISSIDKTSLDSTTKAYAKFLLSNATTLLSDITLSVEDKVMSIGREGKLVEVGGKYDFEKNHITLNNYDINKNTKEGIIEGARIYLHELTHAFLSTELNKYFKEGSDIDSINIAMVDFKLLNVPIPEHIRQLVNLYKVFTKNVTNSGKNKGKDRFDFALTNIHEFYSELMSNTDLQELARKTKYDSTTTIWDKFKKVIRDMFNVNKDPNYVGNDITTEIIGVVLDTIMIREGRTKPIVKPIVKGEVKTDKGNFQGYKGGFENKGKGTPKGDGKDAAMRKVADGFIGEGTKENSSTITSSKEIAIKLKLPVRQLRRVELGKPVYWIGNTVNIGETKTTPKIVMLARNGSLSGKALQEDTKTAIRSANFKKVEFVVGDMPGVDSQFIDYLQEIGAKFTIYHTGDKPRINIENKSTINQEQKSIPTSEYIQTLKNIKELDNQDIKDNNNRDDFTNVLPWDMPSQRITLNEQKELDEINRICNPNS